MSGQIRTWTAPGAPLLEGWGEVELVEGSGLDGEGCGPLMNGGPSLMEDELLLREEVGLLVDGADGGAG